MALALALLVGAPALAQERLGVALDIWAEGSSLSGEQRINASRVDESFGYGSLGAAANLFVLWKVKDRLRVGPSVRILGNYGGAGQRAFLFGFLSEASGVAEYSLPVIEQVHAIFGAKGGFGLLFPGGAFAEEIQRLQAEGVGVWSTPRAGWLAGISVGARRPIAGRLTLRADLIGQYQQLFLFATDEIVDGLRFRKSWSASGIRLGLVIGAEIDL